MVTPENDDGVVRVGTCFKGVENPANHGVGITDVCKVAVNGILNRIEIFKFLVDSGACCLDLFYLRRQVI